MFEFVDGGNLDEFIEQKGQMLSDSDARTIIYALIKAVHYIHHEIKSLNDEADSNIVHRDIKPQNILMDKKSLEKTRLGDFGHSRSISEDMTLDGIGTLQYKAPEIWNLEDYD